MDNVDIEKFGLTVEQTEILYNIECFKILNDIEKTKLPFNNESIKCLKREWLNEWKKYMSDGFSSFLQVDGAELHWYGDEKELIQKVEQNRPGNTWFRLALLEAMLFEPYYTLSFEKDKKGNDVPSKKYKELQNIINGYKKDIGDTYLDAVFSGGYYKKNYISRLRKCYDKAIGELNEVPNTTIVAIAFAITVAFYGFLAVCFEAPTFVIVILSSLTAASGLCAMLAYMVCSHNSKQNAVNKQSAKVLVAVKEIFLSDEHDIEYSDNIYKQYLKNIIEIEKGLVELRLEADVASGKEKKELKEQIEKTEESVTRMKIARKSLLKIKSSFEEKLNTNTTNKKS